jgi:hypothetical protein
MQNLKVVCASDSQNPSNGFTRNRFDLCIIGRIPHIMSMWKQGLPSWLGIIFTIFGIMQTPVQAASPGGILHPSGVTTGAAEWKKLSRPPADTSDAQNLRIWFASRHEGNCRVKVSVVDNSQVPRRQVIDRLLKRGYYNLYWDKRDDSGRQVEPGRYRYIVWSVCAPQSEGTLIVSYRKGERALRLTSDTTSDSAVVVLEVDSAKIEVTLRVLTPDSVEVGVLCSDSVFAIGKHRLVWAPKERLALGDYVVRLTAGDYVTEERVRLK